MRFFTKAVRAAFQALAIACLATNTQTVLAQTNNPQVGYVYPAGGKQGTTVTVIVGGRQLLNVDQVLFSGAGLTARVMRIDRPMTNEERMKFRDELAELRHPTNAPAASPAPVPGAAPTPAPPAKPVIAPKDVPARIAELMRLLTEVPRNQATPALAETVTLEVNIAPDAPIGPHDLRLFGKNGLSLPLTFVVGDLPEAAFPTVTALTPRSAPGSAQAASEAASGGLMVTPPVVVNGQILAGETKRIRFSGHQNQRLIIAVHARALIPYLADAVPGYQGCALPGAGGFRVSGDDRRIAVRVRAFPPRRHGRKRNGFHLERLEPAHADQTHQAAAGDGAAYARPRALRCRHGRRPSGGRRPAGMR